METLNRKEKGNPFYLFFLKRRGFDFKAFSVPEILVTIGVILILSGIILPRYSFFRHKFSLLRSAHKLAQDLRRAQEMATSTRELGGSIPPGYGIYLEEDDQSYVLYADTYPLGGNEGYDKERDQIVETIELGSKIYIKDLSQVSLSLNFKGPDPITTISSGTNSAIIVLGLEGGSEEEEVSINKVGLIYVE